MQAEVSISPKLAVLINLIGVQVGGERELGHRRSPALREAPLLIVLKSLRDPDREPEQLRGFHKKGNFRKSL